MSPTPCTIRSAPCSLFRRAVKARLIVTSVELAESHQPLAVVPVRVFGLHFLVRKEVVHSWNAGRTRMAPTNALNGSKASTGEKVGQRVHADIGKDQGVEVLVGNELAGAFEKRRQRDHLIGAGGDRLRHGIFRPGESKDHHVKLLPRQVADETRIQFADRMTKEKTRKEADPHWPWRRRDR